ncbi:hypothetical protein EDD37DRAFT_642543 [Exophiala viscosa]|uniref:uncharacterized protein n=1 Tax=Exophiala viscosa TaxID=2486360 RepID=UPI00219F2594|nr:hypothetical protein EDD37DRAFT_642543 [Exophiala viscosa]
MTNTLLQLATPSTKRVRKSTPKVRSGCLTCKTRKVKCDEQRPSCSRCLRAGRKCDGYAAIKPNAITTSGIAAYSIPFKIPGSQTDRQLLHYYCCQASWILSTYTDPTLWTELILQRSHNEPIIRNALVALSSLHKDYLCGDFQPASAGDGESRSTPTPAKTASMIARCHRQLRNYLSRNDASAQVALICSLIFYTFESLLGDSQKATWHLDRGLMLLKQSHLDEESHDDPLMVHLTTLLHNLDIQASAFDDRRAPMLNLVSESESRGVVDLVPDNFSDISQAERTLAKLQNWTLNYLIKQVGHRGRTKDELPANLPYERYALATQFDRFAAALSDLTGAQEVKATAEIAAQHRLDTQKLLLCQVHFHSFQHLFSDYLSNHKPTQAIKADECLHPSSTPFLEHDVAQSTPAHDTNALPISTGGQQFRNSQNALETTLSSITSLLGLSHSKGQPTSSPPRTYTLSTNLIAALYFISLKTTNPQTLSSALQLFSHPSIAHSRDGLWDAKTASFVVQNILKLRPNSQAHKTYHHNHNYDRTHEHMDKGTMPTMHTIRPYTPPNPSDAREMQKIQHMSHHHNLPMMQSRRLTVVMLDPKLEPHTNAETNTLGLISPTTNTIITTTASQPCDHDLLLLPPYLPSIMPPFLPQQQQKTAPFPHTSPSTIPRNKDRDCEYMSSLRESWPPVSNCRVPTNFRLGRFSP